VRGPRSDKGGPCNDEGGPVSDKWVLGLIRGYREKWVFREKWGVPRNL